MNLDLSNIIKLLPEFYKALGETFIMVGISSVFGIVAGGLLGAVAGPNLVSPLGDLAKDAGGWYVETEDLVDRRNQGIL